MLPLRVTDPRGSQPPAIAVGLAKKAVRLAGATDSSFKRGGGSNGCTIGCAEAGERASKMGKMADETRVSFISVTPVDGERLASEVSRELYVRCRRFSIIFSQTCEFLALLRKQTLQVPGFCV